MTINKIGLILTEEDINKGLEGAFAKMLETQGEMAKKLKNPQVILKDDGIHFKCKVSMGIMPMPVEAQIKLAPAMNGNAINITLAKVSMMMMGGAAGASALMGQLATAIAGKPGLAVNGDTLTVEIATLAKMRAITLGGKLNTIAVTKGQLAVDFS